MLKVVAVSVAVVLLAGSASFGQSVVGAINQIQNTTIGLGNTIQLMQGSQAADAIQNLAVANDQAGNRACGAYASQSLLANLAEIGHASGDCGIVAVIQGLDAVGSQAQAIGDCCDPKSQAQSLVMLAQQGLVKSEGPGAGNGLHQIVLREEQAAGNPAGTTRESSAILGLQSSTLSGAACATGGVNSSMNVSTVQSQSTL
ncbi:MAG: hypothetical protein JW955_21075 [Sedimentisphaerales bacterium]|nr:hypothetical protein [Sedimentisphaerales bacterium]